MNEINKSQRLRVAAYDESEAAKTAEIMKAEADAESKHLRGMGLARQRLAIVQVRSSSRWSSGAGPGSGSGSGSGWCLGQEQGATKSTPVLMSINPHP